ncbi:MAG: 4Fe-4S dicluster domain-containing protein [Clostridia bacterium]|nr:4Fe-4S dicluster domain-containing protein [Clostridia bacterium]
MKKAIILDYSRCSGCGACVVACMDQNDIEVEKGEPAFRRVYRIEEGLYPQESIQHLSVACMHCEDSPCIMGCPTGAIFRHEVTKAVIVNENLCIGCHSCALACPFGIPRYNMEEKMQKCNFCFERVAAGLKPACVKVCPVGALKFEPINKLMENKELSFVINIVSTSGKGNK